MRHSSLHLKRRAAVLIGTLVAVIALIGAIAPLAAQEPLNLINPLSYGVAFTEATLAAAVRGIGANPQTLVVPSGTWQIQNDLAIPAHVHILPAAGARLTVSRGRTLTIHTFTAPLLPVFGGEGVVVLGSSVPGLYPQWFGAVCDGRADDTAALRMTLQAAAASGSKRVWFTDHSDCRLTDELAIPTGVTLEGLGYFSSRITVDTPPGRRGLVYTAPRLTEAGITIRGLRLIGANTAVGDLLTFRNATDVTIERASIRTTGGTAIVFDFCIGCHVLYSRVETFRGYGVHLNNLSNQSTVIGNTFGANDAPGTAAILIERSGFGAIRDNDLEGNGRGRDGIRLRGAYHWDIRSNFLEHYIGTAVACTDIPCQNIVLENNEIHAEGVARVDFSQGELAHEHIRLTHNRFAESTNRSVMFARGQTRNFEYAFNSKDLGQHVAGYPAHLMAVHLRDRRTLLEGGIRTGGRGTNLVGATPSVGDGNWFLTANRSPTMVTDLRDGFVGQEVIIVCGETHTTLHDGGPLRLNGPFGCTADATLTLLSPDGKSWVELTRSVN